MEIFYSAEQLGISKSELLRARFPHIDIQDYVYLEEGQYGFVDDISQYGLDFNNELAALQQLSKGNILPYSETALTTPLIPVVEEMRQQYGNDQLLMIYPGGGGRRFRKALESQLATSPAGIELAVHRDKTTRLPNMSPENFTLFYEYLAAMPDLKRVVIGDDVVNGGSTLKEIYKWIPRKNIEFVSLSPVILYPELHQILERPYPSSISNVTEIRSTLAIDGPQYPASFNCVSSIMKKESLAEDKRVLELQHMYGQDIIEPLISMQQKCRQFIKETGVNML